MIIKHSITVDGVMYGKPIFHNKTTTGATRGSIEIPYDPRAVYLWGDSHTPKPWNWREPW